MIRYSLLSLMVSSSLLLAGSLSEEEAIQKGSAISANLVQKLSVELKGHMQSSGPLGALNFCSQNALSLTDQVAKESNATIKRVSLNNRNPINSTNADEQALLRKWEKLQYSQQPLPAYEIQNKPNGNYSFYKPIVLNNEVCLKCHGEIASDSPLSKEIKTLYPEDKAVGYKMGDLRGMIVVTFPR